MISARRTPRPTSKSSTPARTTKPLRCAKAAEADVSAIRDWSKAEVERIRVETEQRIARRRELLEQELQEYNSAIEFEIERVQKRVTGFEEEVASFFEQLLKEADPTIFASMAAQMPDPPAFSDQDRGALTTEIKARRDKIMRSDGLIGNETDTSDLIGGSAPAESPEPAAPVEEPAPEPKPAVIEFDAGRRGRPGQRRQYRHVQATAGSFARREECRGLVRT